MESETNNKKYYIIKDRFLLEIDEKEAKDKKYFEDYKIPSADDKTIIYDLDKRNIMPYTAFLLSSMSEFKFVKYARNSFYGIILLIILTIALLAKSNGSDNTIKQLSPLLKTIQTNQISNEAPSVPVRHSNIVN